MIPHVCTLSTELNGIHAMNTLPCWCLKIMLQFILIDHSDDTNSNKIASELFKIYIFVCMT